MDNSVKPCPNCELILTTDGMLCHLCEGKQGKFAPRECYCGKRTYGRFCPRCAAARSAARDTRWTPTARAAGLRASGLYDYIDTNGENKTLTTYLAPAKMKTVPPSSTERLETLINSNPSDAFDYVKLIELAETSVSDANVISKANTAVLAPTQDAATDPQFLRRNYWRGANAGVAVAVITNTIVMFATDYPPHMAVSLTLALAWSISLLLSFGTDFWRNRP